MPEIEQQTLLQLIHVFELHGLRQWHESIFHELVDLTERKEGECLKKMK